MTAHPVRAVALSGRALLLGCTLACGLAQAGSFTVNPIKVTLSREQPVAALTVRNVGATPAVIQLETRHWSQHDGSNVYEATSEVLATPPIFTVPVGKTQLVRIGLRRPPDPGQELSYRLYVQEVAPPPAPGFKGLQMSLRMGVPVFVLPVAPVRSVVANLQWHATRLGPAKVSLSATNAGNAHVQLSQLQLRSVAGTSAGATRQVEAYLLPGQRMAWVMEFQQASGNELHLLAQTDAGNVETDLAVEAQ